MDAQIPEQTKRNTKKEKKKKRKAELYASFKRDYKASSNTLKLRNLEEFITWPSGCKRQIAHSS